MPAGQHVDRYPDPRVVGFYRAITASYPDRPAGPGTPWEVAPLHAAADHVELNLRPDLRRTRCCSTSSGWPASTT